MRIRAFACLVSALVALAVPARADIGTPKLLATSVDTGWSRDMFVVWAKFDRSLALWSDGKQVSDVRVTDRAGGEVPGMTELRPLEPGVLVWRATTPLSNERAPYEVVFTARARLRTASSADLVTPPLRFGVDALAPRPPSILHPTRAGVYAPHDDIVLAGEAEDIGASGLTSLTLRFYDTVGDAPRSRVPSGPPEAVRHRRTIDIACTSRCPDRVEWRHTVSHLPAGVWTLKMTANDRAGNVSPESAPVTLVVTRLP